MLLSLLMILQVLTLGGFLLILTPCEAVVYYVTPTQVSNSDCASQPYHTLDYYFCKGERFFDHEKVNVMIIFMQGTHTLQNCSFAIEHLEKCEIIGIEPAHNVIVHVAKGISFVNTTTVYIETLTLVESDIRFGYRYISSYLNV